MRLSKKFSILSILFITILISGCTQQSNSSSTTISIKDFSFNPKNINIKAGTTITWINEDSLIHDITIDSGLFNQDLEPGEEFSFTFDEPGIYKYHCNIHPSMTGEITITE